MKYFNNIKTGFTVEIDEDSGEYRGCIIGTDEMKPKSFFGVIGKETITQKLHIESILDSAFPDKRNKNFSRAYEALLPGFTGGFLV